MTFALRRPASPADIAAVTGLTADEVVKIARQSDIRAPVRIGRTPFYGELEFRRLVELAETVIR